VINSQDLLNRFDNAELAQLTGGLSIDSDLLQLACNEATQEVDGVLGSRFAFYRFAVVYPSAITDKALHIARYWLWISSSLSMSDQVQAGYDAAMRFLKSAHFDPDQFGVTATAQTSSMASTPRTLRYNTDKFKQQHDPYLPLNPASIGQDWTPL
jgi:phage gp36-like protein